MSLLDRFLPHPTLRQVHHVAVASSPALTWAVVRQVDAFRIGFLRRLFALRALPDRVGARLRGRRLPVARTSRIDDLASGGGGFQILGEDPGREVVVGAIGKLWEPRIPFAHLASAEFVDFATPGFGRVAWSLRVDPRDGGGAWVTFELRVDATDSPSLARLRRSWFVIGRVARAIRDALMHQFVRDLGSAPPPETRTLAGDPLLPNPRFQKTHAVTIEAPPSEIWPWLLQMGGRRGGWYSWDLLDNGGTPSATRIHPELQVLAVGDVIPALPWASGGFGVLELEPGRSLVLGDPALLPGGHRAGGPPWRTTWAFALEPIGADATRLTVRVRADYQPGAEMQLLRPLMSTLHEVMERRQLHNLKLRAEATVH